MIKTTMWNDINNNNNNRRTKLYGKGTTGTLKEITINHLVLLKQADGYFYHLYVWNILKFKPVNVLIKSV